MLKSRGCRSHGGCWLKTPRIKKPIVNCRKPGAYRIGVGARENPPDAPVFFVEVVVNLADESGEVDLPRLEQAISCLKTLQARGYTLTYEDGNCISCETTNPLQNPNEEYAAVEALMKRIFT
ncbi:MAG: hypothetical protein NWF05_09750 [Candidatus Bathyarchaeota archaeon]|nr:hypothetical protein [Candidatus Bathyarchaeota archaeon]